MRSMPWSFLKVLFFCGLLAACSGQRLTIVYDDAEGLRPRDRVVWREQTIGEVQSVARTPEGSTAVQVQIRSDFSQKLTDQSRFFITRGPEQPDQQAVEMLLLGAGGKPLKDGVQVEGSTFFSLQLERSSRELQEWSETYREYLERWKKELSELPVEEWYRQLESQLEYWAEELEEASEETRRYFRKEVLPRLEEAVRELKKRLERLEKDKETEILETKLQELKNLAGYHRI